MQSNALNESAYGDKIGLNYGMLGDNLPPADQVVTLLNGHNIGKMKLFDRDGGALNAFANSGIDVIVGVSNSDLQAISSSQDSANGWVNDNIVPYSNTSIKYITNANLQNIKASTPHAFNVIGNSYPPSKGAFSDDVKDIMSSILKFLSDNGAPFMANVYPYLSYVGDSNDIHLDYALFQPTATAVTNGDHNYNNLFDAMVDSVFSAMEASGYSNIPLIFTESGWPSAGVNAATTENAQAYNNNLIQHVLSNAGTPKRPGTNIEPICSLFSTKTRKLGTR
eukprot:PITA_31526